MRIIWNRTGTKVAVAAAIATIASSAIVLPRVFAAQPAPAADPLAHALGFDDPVTAHQIQSAEGRRQLSYRSAVKACLSAAGFTGVPDSQLLAPTASFTAPVLSDDQTELTNGFGVTSGANSRSRPPDPLSAYAATLSSAEEYRFGQVMAGPTGCDQHAVQKSTGGLLAAGDAFDGLVTGMYNNLAKNSAVKRTGSAWLNCMGRPTAFSNPSQISGYLLNKRDNIAVGDTAALNALSQEEMQLARADVHCRQTVVDPVFQPLLRQAEFDLVSAHGADFAAFRRALLQ